MPSWCVVREYDVTSFVWERVPSSFVLKLACTELLCRLIQMFTALNNQISYIEIKLESGPEDHKYVEYSGLRTYRIHLW